MAASLLKIAVLLVLCGLCSADCVDKYGDCPRWAKEGECQKNQVGMSENCQKSCGICGKNPKPAMTLNMNALKQKLENFDVAALKQKMKGALAGVAAKGKGKMRVKNKAVGKRRMDLLDKNNARTPAEESGSRRRYAQKKKWVQGKSKVVRTNGKETDATKAKQLMRRFKNAQTPAKGQAQKKKWVKKPMSQEKRQLKEEEGSKGFAYSTYLGGVLLIAAACFAYIRCKGFNMQQMSIFAKKAVERELAAVKVPGLESVIEASFGKGVDGDLKKTDGFNDDEVSCEPSKDEPEDLMTGL